MRPIHEFSALVENVLGWSRCDQAFVAGCNDVRPSIVLHALEKVWRAPVHEIVESLDRFWWTQTVDPPPSVADAAEGQRENKGDEPHGELSVHFPLTSAYLPPYKIISSERR